MPECIVHKGTNLVAVLEPATCPTCVAVSHKLVGYTCVACPRVYDADGNPVAPVVEPESTPMPTPVTVADKVVTDVKSAVHTVAPSLVAQPPTAQERAEARQDAKDDERDAARRDTPNAQPTPPSRHR
jgi:hypothetical protein